MNCLAEWENCHSDILEEIKYQEIDCSDPSRLIEVCKHFYIKGILDAYNKLKK